MSPHPFAVAGRNYRNENVFIFGVAALLLIGCSSKEAQLEGKWKFKDIDTSALAANSKDPNAAVGASMAKAFMSSTTAEFKPDKTFTMNMQMLISIPMEGTWTMSGNTVTMTPTKVMGMTQDQMKAAAASKSNLSVGASGGTSGAGALGNPNDMGKPLTATISDDGKTLSLGMDKMPMTLSKESS